MEAFNIGAMFGAASARNARTLHTEIIDAAEVEDDLLDIMAKMWGQDEMLLKIMFQEFSISDIREGWTSGFLDIVFPLRHYA